jgi:hypothetical protein
MNSISAWVDVNHLRYVQNLVKRFDGRFKCNPLCMKYRALVDVSFSNGHNMGRFHMMLSIMDQPFF